MHALITIPSFTVPSFTLKDEDGMSDDRNRTGAKIAVSGLASLLLRFLVFYGFASLAHWWRTRDSSLANLAVEIQRNIQQIDAEKSKTGWEVEGSGSELCYQSIH